MTWIQTASGIKFDFLDPKPEMIVIEDIAAALSKIARFNGHLREFYSVGQHSFHVSENIGEGWALEGLLHDASEAYTGDCVRPLKRLLPGWSDIETRINEVIWERFDLDHDAWPAIKYVDDVLLATEARDLFKNPAIDDWTGKLAAPLPYRIEPWFVPKGIETVFLRRFNTLTQM